MRRPLDLERSSALRLLAAAACGAGVPDAQGRQPELSQIPLERCGGAFCEFQRQRACASYSVEGQRFRAVLDTGSPFLLVPGRLPASGCDDRWGCYADSTASVALGDATTEGFGGQDVGVEWRRGRLDFGDFSFSPINFGVVTSSVRKGGTSAIYLGLVRDRVPRVRPTLLEQTDIESFQFDFPRRRLTLARRPLLRQRDAIPLVDLRSLGAPVAQYACRVERLLVNRAEVPLSRPAVAVLDTGTTGLVLSDTLYESDELPLPGAAMRDVEVIVRTERGRPVALHASSRRYRQSDGEPEEFPLIVTPVSLPWFGLSAPTPLGTPLNFDSSLPPADSAPRPIVLRPRPASALDPAAQARRCDAKQTTEMALVIATPDDTTNVAESDGRLLHGRSPRLSAQKLANAKPITIAACWE
ncbi:hypothetical protein EMIHUDRAFT_119183 [Emiliania huxleyi CCMP1516]|uniref:Peptidase A1 domain-containing protein n=2 Tax=Emiliania huxleyi TaxID=2903 RepID=A0A0D3IXC4_EMIH1|nr:hypothetical protein EMIHUDRAFT_119183 [Emiliania huxleyi CCMP1516]EOD15909.1 hypothetical protein EMIHUDRAFT_119183 [Emiliania huxleyi CCMP1516]|eukprot:XP_005768338.1 hypothetical protein EMIHUDRAFT_119183 [Emiliania huxleyi CCMP1516]